MTNQTRKHIWPVALMSLAVFGVLVAVVALSVLPMRAAQAHGCDTGTAQQQAQCDTEHENAGLDHTDPNHSHEAPEPIEPPTELHATMPQSYALQGLDNGARLNWDAPYMVANNAMVSGYQIERDAWNAMAEHPINMYGDTTIMVGAHETDYRDLGLAYETVYQYRVRAVVQYNVEGWWNMLNCVEMNDAVSPREGEPAVGADTDGTTYCKMYDDLSAAAMVVVQRAYVALDPMEYTYYGEWSMMRAIETADSGGRLMALLDPPSAVRMLGATAACDDRITVRWQAPSDWGTVPASDRNGVYVGPDYIGADDAGREEVGEAAGPGTYQVQRMVNSGPWASVTPVGMTYTDANVTYGSSYKYRVRAMNSQGLYGPWVMVMEALMEPDQPQMPRSLNVDPVNSTVEMQWDAPMDDASDPLWRTMADFNLPGDDSSSLQYVIERKVGNSQWVTVATQYHKYADNFEDTLTQAFTDMNPPVGLVSYRVAALVHGCNPSPYNQKDPVTVVAQPLGSATGLSAAAGTAAGTVELSWTAGTSSTRHWLAGVKVSDWQANDFSNVIFRAAASQNSDTVTGLDSGQQYAFTVLSGDANTWDDTWAPIQYITPN